MPTYNKYIFTYFKYPKLIDIYLERLSYLENFRYVVAQIEPTSCELLHIQGYIEFTKPTARKMITKIMEGCHVEPKSNKSTRLSARYYCMKDYDGHYNNEYFWHPPKTKNIHRGHFPNETYIELGTWIQGQGARTDIDAIKNLVKNGKTPLKDIIFNHCQSFQQMRIAEKLVQYHSITRNTPPLVIWIYGATGTGKTKYVFDKHKPEDIYMTMDTYKWWDGYEQQQVILIDDMRKDFCKFHILLKLLDRYPHRVQIKGGTTQINSPYIYITTPYHWKELYKNREDINQLGRRITKTILLGETEPKRNQYGQIAGTYDLTDTDSDN